MVALLLGSDRRRESGVHAQEEDGAGASAVRDGVHQGGVENRTCKRCAAVMDDPEGKHLSFNAGSASRRQTS